jgi:hypothetical protein
MAGIAAICDEAGSPLSVKGFLYWLRSGSRPGSYEDAMKKGARSFDRTPPFSANDQPQQPMTASQQAAIAAQHEAAAFVTDPGAAA